jgi:hypothetical protein
LEPLFSSGVFTSEEIIMSDKNDLEGKQDMGGKHGGQAGRPQPLQRPKSSPKSTERDEDVVHKDTENDRRAAQHR